MRGQKRKRKKMIKNETLIRSTAITANTRAGGRFNAACTLLADASLWIDKQPHYNGGVLFFIKSCILAA